MTRPPAPIDPIRPGSPEEDALLLDALRGELSPGEAQALSARLAADPRLAERRRRLARLEAALLAAVCETPEPGLSQRLALRVRDGVAHEEHAAHRARAADRSARWSRRAWVRIVLGSLAVHVLLLGWIVWRDHDERETERARYVAGGWSDPEVRDPSGPGDADAPLDIADAGIPDSVVVVSEAAIPDSLLEDYGLGGDDGRSSFPEPHVRVAEHPREVQFPMLSRQRDAVKLARLARAGLDARGTRSAVERGLTALAQRQSADGSFPLDLTAPAAARRAIDTLGMTGLALLPFLAEGRCSVGPKGAVGDPVVARGVAWLRSRVGAPAGTPEKERASTPASSDLALAVLALSEDYMLAYGRFTPAEGQARGRELRALGERLAALQREDGSFGEGAASGEPSAALWPILALDAVRHTGVGPSSSATTERFQRWFAALPRAAEGLPAGPDGRADAVLTAGAAMLGAPRPHGGRQEERPAAHPDAVALATSARFLVGADVLGNGRGALTALAASTALYRRDTASFLDWNRAHGEALLARLAPSGVVLRGDPVADTALVLLALQSSYRAY